VYDQQNGNGQRLADGKKTEAKEFPRGVDGVQFYLPNYHNGYGRK
jgi:hypothetical protein